MYIYVYIYIHIPIHIFHLSIYLGLMKNILTTASLSLNSTSSLCPFAQATCSGDIHIVSIYISI